jgi:hypothetical protein
MSLGTAARLRDVAALAIDEFHLKIVAPHASEAVSGFTNSSTHFRISEASFHFSPFFDCSWG